LTLERARLIRGAADFSGEAPKSLRLLFMMAAMRLVGFLSRHQVKVFGQGNFKVIDLRKNG
jgi:hypothetical protein